MNEDKQGIVCNKARNVSICIVFLIFIFGIFAATLLKKESKFSSSENRVLATKPTFSMKTLLDGSYTQNYEKYITDQFVLRDQWIAMKVYAERAVLKKEINGVYFGEDHYLLQQHKDSEVDEGLVDLNVSRLDQFIAENKAKYNMHTMIVPTATSVLTDKVPNYAPEYNQNELIDRVKDTVGDDVFVDTRETLNAHKNEYIYYRTDHHWTSLGAYYAYVKWAEELGITPYKQEEFNVEEATKDFLGTTYSKVNIKTQPDSIHLYNLKENRNFFVRLNQNDKTTLDGLYDRSKLQEKDKYPVFLGGNNAYVEINSSEKNGKTLLVIKDSYGHTIVPLLANHYEKIIMLDYRYFNGSTKKVLEEEGITDVLVMYNAMNFVQDKNFLKVLK